MPRDLEATYREYLRNFTTMNVATAMLDGEVDNATVYFAVNDDGTLCFASLRETIKSRNLAANGRVAITMNDGGATPTGIQIRGRAFLMTLAEERRRARELLLERVAAIESYLDQPGIRYFRVEPEERFLINFAWGIDWRSVIT